MRHGHKALSYLQYLSFNVHFFQHPGHKNVLFDFPGLNDIYTNTYTTQQKLHMSSSVVPKCNTVFLASLA
jgi:hypothetical protein